MTDITPLDDAGYEALSDFRYELRRFLAFAEDNAREKGLTVQQHQLLLAIRGHYAGDVSINWVAERLLIKPHSASELVNRLESRSLVIRSRSEHDGRRVCLRLTPLAEQILAELSSVHRSEIERIQPSLLRALRKLSRPKST
ncbi:MarR family winged helix-turn-helix transcriptional regulator [Sphingobium sp. BS19]|uniref:MarR family winged helix-turn-helix transcriptional regulator n=1 Tax=Sphingobium sp. BS19 TaxID=3018973 RepID=UPI0022EFB9EF|nr:helix-turn-helix domain-containing protein [Sphingobium sp. BS19]GLI98961.1 MarR family transcriptional regulator [Sphingobium sp. BS19]